MKVQGNDVSPLMGLDPVSKKLVPVAWTVDQTEHDVVRIRLGRGYSSAVFQSTWRHLEVVIIAPDGEETWRLRLQDADEMQTIMIAHIDENTLEVRYERPRI